MSSKQIAGGLVRSLGRFSRVCIGAVGFVFALLLIYPLWRALSFLFDPQSRIHEPRDPFDDSPESLLHDDEEDVRHIATEVRERTWSRRAVKLLSLLLLFSILPPFGLVEPPTAQAAENVDGLVVTPTDVTNVVGTTHTLFATATTSALVFDALEGVTFTWEAAGTGSEVPSGEVENVVPVLDEANDTFEFVATKTGVSTITVTADNGGVTQTAVVTKTWIAGDLDHYELTSSTGPLALVGECFTVTVRAFDVYDNFIPTDASEADLTFLTNDPPPGIDHHDDPDCALPPSNDNDVQLAGGVGTKNLVGNESETITVIATEKPPIVGPAATGTLVVRIVGIPASATVEPAIDTNTVGEAHTVTVTVFDKDNVPVPTGPTDVVIAVSGTGGEAPDILFTGANDSGIATFTFTSTKTGTSTIGAFIDDGSGGLITAFAEKVWIAEVAHHVHVAPISDVNVVGEDHTVTATVHDMYENVVSGRVVTVTFTFDAGDTGGESPSSYTTTTTSGIATFTFTSSLIGTSEICVFAEDGTAVVSACPVATKTWVPSVPASIILDQSDPTNTVGDDHFVTATVTDEFGNPVADGAAVTFTITGQAATQVVRFTLGGEAYFDFTSTQTGQSIVTASADGTVTVISNTVTKTWVPDEAVSIELLPLIAKNQTGTAHSVWVTIYDQYGNVVDSVHNVEFNVSGTGGEDPEIFIVSSTAGMATFTFTSTLTGTSTIEVRVEIDPQQFLFATATKIWHGPPSSLTATPILETNTVGDTHTVVATVTDDDGVGIPGVTVTFTALGTGFESALSPPVVGTDFDGNAVFSFTSTKTGRSTVTVEGDGVGVTEVYKDWIAGDPVLLDCNPETATNSVIPPDDAEVYECRVADIYDNPVSNTGSSYVDGENMAGANDPDDDASGFDGFPDYSGTGTVVGGTCSSFGTGPAGTCTAIVEAVDGQAGDALICFWISDPSYDFDPSGVDESGGQCDDSEPAGELENNDNSDSVIKTWLPGPPTTVTVTPDHATNTIGETHSVTATVVDIFGNAVIDGTTVTFTASGTGGEDPTSAIATTTDGLAFFDFTSDETGTSTVVATAGTATATATKRWADVGPSVVIDPPVDTNTVEYPHKSTATVVDEFGNPLGEPFRFLWEVAGTGVEDPDGKSLTFQPDGQDMFTFTSTQAGTSVITVSVEDPDGPGGAMYATATKYWHHDAPDSVEVVPESATNTVGFDHTITVTAEDQHGNPVGPGHDVTVTITTSAGDEIVSSAITDADGVATVSFTTTTAGDSTITAEVCTSPNEDGNGAGCETGTATKHWHHAEPDTIVASPTDATNEAGEIHTITAVVEDEFGNPVGPGHPATGTVTGAGAQVITGETDENGVVTLTFTSFDVGDSTVTVVVCSDGSHNGDGGGVGCVTDTVFKTWVHGPPAIIDVFPPVDTNTVGFLHKVTAAAYDQYGNPIETGHPATMTVVGPGGCGFSAFDETDGEGIVDGFDAFSCPNEGTSVITVVVSADGTDGHGAGIATGTALKHWHHNAPVTVVVTPAAEVNPLGEDHVIMATAEDIEGNPIHGHVATLTVDGLGGPSPQTATSDSNGKVTFTVSSTVAGDATLTVEFCTPANPDGNGAGCKSGVATKTWQHHNKPFTVDVNPADDTNTVGFDHTVTVTATDDFGNPVGPGHLVEVVAEGPGGFFFTDLAFTNASGQAVFNIGASTWAGDTKITVTVTSDGIDGGGEGQANGFALKTWHHDAPDTIMVFPPTDTNTVGDGHVVTAMVTDQYGNPVGPGHDATLTVLGPDGLNVTRTGTTDANGKVTFSSFTSTKAGDSDLTVEVCTDANEDGNGAGCDTGSASKTWHHDGPTTVTVESDINTVGDDHLVMATAVDFWGNPVGPGHPATMTATGPDGLLVTRTGTTDADGKVTFSAFTTTKAGQSAITVTVSSDGTDGGGSGSAEGYGTKDWHHDGPQTVTVTPPTATNEAGDTHTVMAMAVDQYGNPVGPGHPATMTVTGPGSYSAVVTGTTDSDGKVWFDFRVTTPVGTSLITVTVSSDGADGGGSGSAEGYASKNWTFEGAKAVILVPEMETNTVGTTHRMTATVVDEFGNQVVKNYRFIWDVRGPQGLRLDDEEATTDGTDIFEFTSTLTGKSNITVSVDDPEAGTLIDTAMKFWHHDVPENMEIMPESDVNTVGNEHMIMVTTTDQYGNAVGPGDPVTMTLLSGECSGLFNCSFETGDTSGWDVGTSGSGTINVETFHSMAPFDGSFLLALGGGSEDVPTFAEQSLFLGTGEAVSGYAAFDCHDGDAFNDDAAVVILDASDTPVASPFFADCNDVGSTPWTLWSFTASTPGTYTVSYQSTNRGDSIINSHGLFDGVTGDSSSVEFTDSNGKVTFTFSSEEAGTTDIHFEACSNHDHSFDGEGIGCTSGSASKDWHHGAPDFVDVTPPTATNDTGDDHVVSATITDEFGNPVGPGHVATMTVVGAGGPVTITGSTDENGVVTFSYASVKPGDDTITVTACTDGSDTGDGMGVGCASGSATKTWVGHPHDVPFTVTVSPQEATNTVGETHTITVTGIDEFGNPIGPDHDVTVTVVGPQAFAVTLTGTTDGSGVATFAFSQTKTGSSLITATVASDASDGGPTGTASDTAIKHWTPGTATTVDLRPPSDTNVIGTQHAMAALILDQYGNPVADGVTVGFATFGTGDETPANGSDTTSGGLAEFSFTSNKTGTSTIVAFIDENTADIATKRWICPARLFSELIPYPGFNGGIFVAGGDVNGDGCDEIITGAGVGGGPHVKVFNGRNGALMASFMAYDIGFRGGVRVGAGDVDADGKDEVLVSPGSGFVSPPVRVYNIPAPGGSTPAFSFVPYPGFRGGVFVAGGDIDGDGFDDIITGADSGGGPHVFVRSGRTGGTLKSFMAYETSFRGGVRVGAGDVDNAGSDDEIITGPGAGRAAQVRVFQLAGSAPVKTFLPYTTPRTHIGGLFVAGGDIVVGNAGDEIITGADSGGGPNNGGGPHVKVFNFAGTVIQEFMAFATSFRGGVRVGTSDVDGNANGEGLVGRGPGTTSTPARLFE